MSNEGGCELCGKPARMFCESDQARLCWDCDEKVHAANFLVAKHYRTLLCHACASPTPWKASGLKLGHAVSVCSSCVEGEARSGAEGSGGFGNGNRDCDSQESESDDGEYYNDEEEEDDEEEEEEEEEGENQVVPWSICSAATPSEAAPTAPSSSCSEDDASFFLWKRMRDHNHPVESENEEGCCSSHNLDSKLASPDSSFQESENLDSSEQTLFRPLKLRRTNTGIVSIPSERTDSGQSPENSSAAIVRTVIRFQQENHGRR
ncbi:uncharacterized protein LOC142540712 [Primulina tabacum]|uniref:uncharacterized protein LOC142540712 n=1 Tax=Primulina tabacum TaxID=48773 RepID=UPI003F59FE91